VIDRGARWVAMLVVVVAASSFVACRKTGSPPPTPLAAFRVGVVEPASIDPAKAATVDELLIADQLFDGLTAWSPTTGQPQPSVASAWTTSADGLHWEFTLRDDATFSDGKPVTATDVSITLDRIRTEATASSVRDLLESVAGITAVSEHLLRLELSAPWADLPSALANPAFGIVPSTIGEEIATIPVGSGPYRVERRSSKTLSLRSVKGRGAKVDRVEVRFFADRGASYRAFLGRQLDWSQVPSDRVDEAAARYGRALFRPYAAELFYAFNLRSPKWADKRLREAVVRAIDRQAIVDKVYGGSVLPMTGVVGAGIEGHAADACGGACSPDVERAKALVAEVRGDGAAPDVSIDFESDTTQSSVAEAMKAALENVGFAVTLRGKPLDEYQKFAVSGQADFFRLGWVPAYPAADAYLHPVFASGSPNNLPGFSVTAIDDLLRAARATNDAPSRAGIYTQAESAILSELPVVPIAQFEFHAVASSRTRGVELGVMGTFDVAKVSLTR
jgi:ABC-type oligopeptide transport system substrate-binding subunit